MTARSLGLAAAVAVLAAFSTRPGPTAAQSAPEFKQYYFVLLWAGPNQGGTPEEIESVQRGHMENIARLVREGKLAIAGPFEDGGKLRGIFILDVPTKAEAEAVIATDPAVQAGRLRPEILTWWSERGRALP